MMHLPIAILDPVRRDQSAQPLPGYFPCTGCASGSPTLCDQFADTGGTALTAHTPDAGGPWLLDSSGSFDGCEIDADGVGAVPIDTFGISYNHADLGSNGTICGTFRWGMQDDFNQVEIYFRGRPDVTHGDRWNSWRVVCDRTLTQLERVIDNDVVGVDSASVTLETDVQYKIEVVLDGNDITVTLREVAFGGVLATLSTTDATHAGETLTGLGFFVSDDSDPGEFLRFRAEMTGGWSYYKEITVQDTNVDGDLTDFPLLVKFAADGDVGAAARSDGFDVRFRASDGITPLPFDRRSFALAGGNASGTFFVKVPSILASGGATIRMYYGNAAAATDAQDRATVWSDYAAVWPLDEDPSGSAPQMKDVSGQGKHGTTGGSMSSGQSVAGTINNRLDFDGSDDTVDVTGLADLTGTWSVSMWFQRDNSSRAVDDTLFSRWVNSTTNRQLIIVILPNTAGANSHKIAVQIPFIAAVFNSNTAISNTNLHHIVATRTGSTWKLYLDGVDDGGATNSSTQETGSTTRIGANTSGLIRTFDGKIDEVRASATVAFSLARAKFEYRNTIEADNELTFGSEQTA